MSVYLSLPLSISIYIIYILLTKATAAQTEDVLSYYRVRGLYFLAVIFVRSIGKLKKISRGKIKTITTLALENLIKYLNWN